MEKDILLEGFLQESCKTAAAENGNALVTTFPADREGRLIINDIAEVATLEEWKDFKFIVFNALNQGPHSMAMTLEFWDESNKSASANLVSTLGLLPGLKTRIAFPLEALNSQNMFLERTPGRLKAVIHGNKVNRLKKLAIGRKKCSDEQTLVISGVYLSDTEPDYPVPDLKLSDEIGQWTMNEWPGKTKDAEELKDYLRQELEKIEGIEDFTGWSGSNTGSGKKVDGTGFFRTYHDGDRWWLADPDGYLFFSAGVDCVRPGDGCNVKGIEHLFKFLPERETEYADAWSVEHDTSHFNFTAANLIRAFGADWKDGWTRITRKRLLEWGINTIGNWSWPYFIKAAKIPYVWPLRDFPQTDKKIFRDFPDVFSKEYRLNSQKFAEQLKGFENDKYMIGYFLRNEPTWAFIEGLNIAEELLENKGWFDTKDAFIEHISKKYAGDIQKFNSAWKLSLTGFNDLRAGIRKASTLSKAAEADLKEFSRIMTRLYVEIPSREIRKVDRNHLNLGMRYGYISSEELLAGCENFDIFSVNCYDVNPYEVLEKIGRMTGLPVMIGEYHFGALDRGLSATGIRAVTTQNERGRAYRYYLENAASSKYCVGAHYFQYNDQPTLGRFDGENYQIGLVDQCQKPHFDFIAEMVDCHGTLYEVAGNRKEKYDIKPDLIYPIFF